MVRRGVVGALLGVIMVLGCNPESMESESGVASATEATTGATTSPTAGTAETTDGTSTAGSTDPTTTDSTATTTTTTAGTTSTSTTTMTSSSSDDTVGESESDASTGEPACDPGQVTMERVLPIGVAAMIASPGSDGLILQRATDRGEELVEIDLCGAEVRTLVAALPSSFNAALQRNGAGTLVYFVHEMGFDEELRRVAYPDGGVGETVAPLGPVRSLAVDPGDAFALYKINGGDAFRVDFDAPDNPVMLAIDPLPAELAIAPTGLHAAYKDNDDDIYVWDLQSDVKTFAVAAATVNSYPIAWAGDRIYHVAGEGFDTFVRAYDIQTEMNATIEEVDAAFFALAVAPDETWYARGNGVEITLAPLP